MSWEEIKIGSICKVKHGYAFKSTFFSDNGEYILLSPGNFFEAGGLKSKGDKEKYYVGEFPSDYILNESDLLLVMTDLIQNAPLLGGCAIVPTDNKFLHNQRLGKITNLDENKIDKKYFYYCLNEEYYRGQIRGTATGATVRHTAPERIYNAKINIPKSLETQKCIANIPSNYDDLIENNLKRIKLLEEMAQNIYKEWFVNFRFPNYEHTEFDEESGLPVGWEKKTIGTFADVITGKTPSTVNSNFFGGNVPFVKTPDMHNAPYVLNTSISLSNEGAESQNNKFLPKNSVMVSCIGTAGVVALASTNCQTNQQINSVKFDEDYKSFYFYGFARGLRTLLEGLGSNGATMVNVNKSKFEKIELIIPDNEVLKKHYGLVKVIFDQILILQEQNEKLKEARDILLPRLMNRTIEV